MGRGLRLLAALLLGTALAAADTVVVLVRHAEKVSEEADAELSAAGRARAERLAALLAPRQAEALFASHRRRTRQTLEPLAKRSGLPIQVRKAGEEAALAAEILARWKGRTVIVCGHSNTLGPLAAALGVREPFTEPKGYDRWWTVRIAPDRTARIEEHEQP